MIYSQSNPKSPAATQRAGGFTIIETLFVLAIAGLILLIVFGAIPTLQRNSRNNQRKQDVAAVLQAISRWELSNAGNLPDASSNFLQFSQTEITYYAHDPASVRYGSSGSSGINIYAYPVATSAPASITGNNSTETIDIHNYQKCNANGDGSSTRTGAGYGDVVALFALETSSSNPNSQCQEL